MGKDAQALFLNKGYQTYLQDRNRLADFENTLMVTPKGTGGVGDGLGVGDWHVNTEVNRRNGQRGPAVQHRDL